MKSDELTNNSPVVRLKQCINSIKAEIKNIDRAIGITQESIFHYSNSKGNNA
jgi:hypothetical protein